MKERIEKFLNENYRSLIAGKHYYSFDNNSNRDPYDWEDSHTLKICMVYLTDAIARGVSNTHNALTYLIKKNLGDKVFVDIAYLPLKEDAALFDREGIPYCFGAISHRPLEEYDALFISCACITEVMSIVSLYDKSNIPLTIEQRDAKGDYPLILFGGASAAQLPILFGPIHDRHRNPLGRSLVDVANFGYGEVIVPDYVDLLYNAIIVNKVKGRKNIREYLIDNANSNIREHYFYPEYYTWNMAEDNYKILSVTCTDPRLPERPKYNKILPGSGEDVFCGFPVKIFNMDGVNAESMELQTSSGCSGQDSVCAFCYEATAAGGYSERPNSAIEKDCRDFIKIGAPNSLSPYAYNVNYHSQFLDQMNIFASHASNISIHNERMDIISKTPEHMEVARACGFKSMASPIEGCSDRIRNGYLNKNLTKEQILKAFDNTTHLGLLQYKIGLIKTQEETKEDLEEWINTLEDIFKIFEKKGCKSMVRCNWTPLFIYSMTALRYRERKTAIRSFNGIKDMGWFLDEIKARGIPVRNKFHAPGLAAVIQQLILDAGPAQMPILMDWYYEGLNDKFKYNDEDKALYVKTLKQNGYDDPLFFAFERPLDWFFPTDFIDCFEPECVEHWRESTQRWRDGDPHAFNRKLCLRTVANGDDPSAHKCHKCGNCKTPQQIAAMCAHKFNQDEHNLSTVLDSLANNRPRYAINVVLDKKSDIISTKTLRHYVTALIFRQDNRPWGEDLSSRYYKASYQSTNWVDRNGYPDYFKGKAVYPIEFKTYLSEEDKKILLEAIPKVNEILESAKIERIEFDTFKLEPKSDDMSLYLGVISNVSMSVLSQKVSTWDGTTRIREKDGAGTVEGKASYPELKDKIFFVQGAHGKIYSAMVLPNQISPYGVLAGILGKSMDKIPPYAEFSLRHTGRKLPVVDKFNLHLVHDLITGEPTKYSLETLSKLYLKSMLGNH